MVKCVACNKTTLLPEYLDTITFCKTCALKIRLPLWRYKQYDDIEDLVSQKKKSVKLAENYGFSKASIHRINEYFDNEINSGFLKGFHGGCGQSIKIYTDYCVIDTRKDQFDINYISKEYARALKSTRPKQSFMEDKTKVAALTKGVLSGKIVKAGLGLATSLALDVAQNSILPKREKMEVKYGKRYIKYSSIESVEFMDATQEEIGFLRIYNNSSVDLFFFEGTNIFTVRNKNNKVRDIYEVLNERVENNYISNTKKANRSEMDNFEAIKKYKELLEDGIISQEEFDMKKKELLDL